MGRCDSDRFRLARFGGLALRVSSGRARHCSAGATQSVGARTVDRSHTVGCAASWQAHGVGSALVCHQLRNQRHFAVRERSSSRPQTGQCSRKPKPQSSLGGASSSESRQLCPLVRDSSIRLDVQRRAGQRERCISTFAGREREAECRSARFFGRGIRRSGSQRFALEQISESPASQPAPSASEKLVVQPGPLVRDSSIRLDAQRRADQREPCIPTCASASEKLVVQPGPLVRDSSIRLDAQRRADQREPCIPTCAERKREAGWDAGIRTPILRSRVACPNR